MNKCKHKFKGWRSGWYVLPCGECKCVPENEQIRICEKCGLMERREIK